MFLRRRSNTASETVRDGILQFGGESPEDVACEVDLYGYFSLVSTEVRMEFIFDGARTVASAIKWSTLRVAFAAFAVLMAWITVARAGDQANGSAALPDVGVFAPKAPTDQELAAEGLYQFIVHHATTPYPSSEATTGGLARWRGGRPETICPLTLGLDPGYNAFVTARLRALAAHVGAPVQPDLQCVDNVRIVFTTEPDKLMDEVLTRAASRQGVKYPHQMDKQLAFSSSHAVQGWYVTAGGGGNILNADPKLIGRVELLPLWPLVIQTGLKGGGCCNGGIVSAIFVVNTTLVAGYTIGAIADYVSMLALSMVELPDHCDPLPSILDLMAPSCGAREKPSGITAGDLAFLKALYYHNTGLGRTLTRDEVQVNMMQQFKGR
jgi:hypothetical protein